jgi:8-hydroxy-5-deazaflavin:NADPH oxidoreductase
MSTVSIIGTGNMARGIGTRALAGGNDVQILGRDNEKAAAVATDLGGGDKVTAGVVGDPLTGDVVVFALPYPATLQVAQQYGDQLAGKVVVEITNPLDLDTLHLATPPESSAAQELAKALPSGASVVKAFNTTFAGSLVEGQIQGQPLDVFIASDDASAKQAVTQLVESGGLRAIDAGDLSRARYLEGMGAIHINTQMTRGTQFSTALRLVD